MELLDQEQASGLRDDLYEKLHKLGVTVILATTRVQEMPPAYGVHVGIQTEEERQRVLTAVDKRLHDNLEIKMLRPHDTPQTRQLLTSVQ